MRKSVGLGLLVVLLAIVAVYLLNRGKESDGGEEVVSLSPTSTPFPTPRPAVRRRVTPRPSEFPATPEPSPEPESASRLNFFGSVTVFRDGESCPGAIVRSLASNSGLPAATALTDSDGRYRIENLPPDYYVLTAETPDGRLSSYPEFLYKPNKQFPEVNREVNLVFAPLFTIPCRVVNAITNEGVNGAEVIIGEQHAFLPDRLSVRHLVTDSNGRFDLPGHGIGRHDFKVTAPGYVETPIHHDVEEDWVMDIVKGQTPEELVIPLEPRTGLDVTVRYSDGSPGARLAVWPGALNRSGHYISNSAHTWSEYMTDGDGTIRLDTIHTGETGRLLVVKVRDNPFGAEILAMSEPVSVQRGECRQVEIIIEGSGSISGRVLTDASMPIEEVTVTTRILNNDDIDGAERRDVTNANGDFSLSGVAPGRVEITASHPDFEEVSETILVRPDLETSGIILHMTPAYKIGGTVYDSSGSPFFDAIAIIYPTKSENPDEERRVMWNGLARCKTGRDGRFLFHSLAPGGYRLLVSGNVKAFGRDRPDMMTRQFDNVEAGTTNLRVVLGNGPTAFGRVVDAGSGAPITEFDITWQQLENTDPKVYADGGRQHYSDPSGEFRMENLREGWDFYLEVNAEGYARTRTDLFDLIDAEDYGPIIVRMMPGYEVSGRSVKGDTGEPLAECPFRLEPIPYHPSDRDSLWLPAATDKQGRFTVPDVAPGQYLIVFRPTAQTVRTSAFGGWMVPEELWKYKYCEHGPFEIRGPVDFGDLSIPARPSNEPPQGWGVAVRVHGDGF